MNQYRITPTQFLCALLVACAAPPLARAQIGGQAPNLSVAGVHLVGAVPSGDRETAQLDSIFGAAIAAAESVPPGLDAGAKRRAIDDDLRDELGSWVSANTNSPWAPGLNLWLARRAELRSAYASAMDYFTLAWQETAYSAQSGAGQIALTAGSGLAKLLVLTGRVDAYDALENAVTKLQGGRPGGSEWEWARKLRNWVRVHPDQAYKCGLYCLDQLGRLTAPGKFLPRLVLEVPSSLNGFTAADLVGVAANAGLPVHAALLTDTTQIPVPCILHLRSEHFVAVREKRGAFYDVFDPVAYGRRWLTAAEIAEEASGCVIVSDASPLTVPAPLSPMDLATALE